MLNLAFRIEKWSLVCHISRQGCHSRQWLQPSDVRQWPLRELRKKNTYCLAAITLQLQPWGTQDVKRGYWPQIAEVHWKGMISVNPDSCIFPFIKSTKFLNVGYTVYLNLQKIFCGSGYLPFVAKSLYKLAPQLAVSEQFTQDYLRCCLMGLKS